MSTIGIGMIGCGGMGRFVARRVLAQDKRLELRGICDPDARSVAATHEELAPDVRRYRNYRELVSAADIDWVMIASWNCFHREHVEAACRAGKHVFCQKPLATTLSDALAMKRAHEKSNGQFCMGFNLRRSPHYRKLKELLAGGAVGEIVSMEFNETLGFNHGGYIMGDWRRLRKNSGTHILEKCCHDVDLANWYVESRASRVASFGGLNFYLPRNQKQAKRIGKDKNGHEAYRAMQGLANKNPFTAKKDIVDNQVAIIEYANGVHAAFHTNCNAAIPERRMYILGSEGALRADIIAGTIELQRIGFETEIENVDTGASGGHGGGDEVLAAELADTMLNGTPPRSSLQDGLEAAITCFGVDRALDTGRVVDLAPMWKRADLA